METTTVIITKGTSAQAQIAAKNYPASRVIFADTSSVPDVLVKAGKYIQLPALNSVSFIHELLKVCLDQEASVLVLLSDDEKALIEPQKLLFEEFNIQLK